MNVLLRSARGIASTLEVLSIIRHYEGHYGLGVFKAFLAPRV